MKFELEKRTFLLAALLVISLAIFVRSVLAVAVPYGPNADEADKNDDKVAAGPTEKKPSKSDEPEPGSAFRERSFKGRGVKVTPKFSANTGLTLFKVTRQGSGFFSIQLKTAAGADKELIANQDGNIDGSKAVGLEAGEYVLWVAGAGDWTVDVGQPAPGTAKPAPVQLAGKASRASEFFMLKNGPATFKMTHSGEGIFAPVLLNAKGPPPIEVLANEAGPFTGGKTVPSVEEGIYVIDVTADGDWTISVSQ